MDKYVRLNTTVILIICQGQLLNKLVSWRKDEWNLDTINEIILMKTLGWRAFLMTCILFQKAQHDIDLMFLFSSRGDSKKKNGSTEQMQMKLYSFTKF